MRAIAFIAASILALTACASEGTGDATTSGAGASTSNGAGGGDGGESSGPGTGGSTSTASTGGASSSSASAGVGGESGGNGPVGVGGAGGSDVSVSGIATIAWSNYSQSQASCWFFSDPTIMGDSAEWSIAGSVGSLSFPANATGYSGTWPPSSPQVFGGVHTDTFEGDTWQYTEKFQGTVSGNTFTGTWTYSECNLTLDPGSCPADGLCFGSAQFVITLPE